MKKRDLTKEFKSYYTAGLVPELVEFGAVSYLAIDGQGDPSGAGFAGDLQLLYSVAYAIKFRLKNQGSDFVVSKLEGLWWYDEQVYGRPSMSEAPLVIPRSVWYYTLMIRMPEAVDQELVKELIKEVSVKKKLPAVSKVYFKSLDEGLVLQVLHTGPFSAEPDTLAKIALFCQEHGLEQNGTHHEIYLSDFRKTPEDRLRTVLREPVKRKQI